MTLSFSIDVVLTLSIRRSYEPIAMVYLLLISYTDDMLTRPHHISTVLLPTIHYSDVIMSAMASQITGVSIVCSLVFFPAQIKENIKAPRHWPCEDNPPVTGGIISQRASNVENASI